MNEAHRVSKIKRKYDRDRTTATALMSTANSEFIKYQKCLSGESNEDHDIACVRYQSARNAVT